MSDTDRHQFGYEDGTLPLAALLRLAADGEISADQERQLEIELERDPTLASRIEAEQLMRASLERAFDGGPAAPAGLRERITGALADLDLEAEVSGRTAGDADSGHAEEAVPTRMAPMTRSQSFWSGPAARVMAAAAALTLIATVFIVTRGTGTDPQIGSRTRAVQFVASEHGRCVADIAAGAEKFVLTSPDDIPGFTGDVLGHEITLADLVASGIENVSFVDAGRCSVPGGGKSLHLRFEVPTHLANGDECVERFSLFVQHDTGRLGLAEGVSYELDPSKGGTIEVRTPTVYVWVRNQLVYYLVVDNATACPKIREGLSAPADIRSLTNAA